MPRRGPNRESPSLTRRIVLAALVPMLFAAGCTAGPSTRPAIVQHEDTSPPRSTNSAPRSVPLPPLEQPQTQAINWRDCNEQTRKRLGERGAPEGVRFSCAGVIVKTEAPGPGQTGIKRIHVVKAGNGPIPLAVLNDIGGAPGSLYAARLAGRLPADMLNKFSLIGIDRRGSGMSDPLNCIPAEVRTRLLGHDPAEGSIASLVDAARSAGQKCAIALESDRRAYNSPSAAADLEQIRKALGMSHLNALARGEGSNVLTAYAKRYPDRVGRFVLNGVPDPSPNARTVFSTMAKATRQTLEAFDADCRGAECPLEGDARTAVTGLTDRLRSEPATTATGVRMGPALALRAIRVGLGQPQRWPELADAIAAAGTGRADELAAFVEPMLRGGHSQPPRLGVTIATLCNDSAKRLPTHQINELLAQLQQQHPLFAGIAAQRLAWCSPWPPREQPIRLADITEVPPIMVTSSAADPVTPERATARAASQLPTAARVSWQGAGHGALRSGCVVDAVRGFLAEGTVPQQRTLCPA